MINEALALNIFVCAFRVVPISVIEMKIVVVFQLLLFTYFVYLYAQRFQNTSPNRRFPISPTHLYGLLFARTEKTGIYRLILRYLNTLPSLSSTHDVDNRVPRIIPGSHGKGPRTVSVRYRTLLFRTQYKIYISRTLHKYCQAFDKSFFSVLCTFLSRFMYNK